MYVVGHIMSTHKKFHEGVLLCLEVMVILVTISSLKHHQNSLEAVFESTTELKEAVANLVFLVS